MDTKEILARTLKKMMQTIPVEHITINQLTEQANVARNTFYYHFSHINDLVAWIYEQEIITKLSSYRYEADWSDGLDVLTDYILCNRKFCLNTFRSLNRNLLEKFLYRVAFDMVKGVVDNLQADCKRDVRDEICNFFGWAIAIQIIQWLISNLTESKDEFKHRIQRVLNGTISHILMVSEE